MWCSCTNAGRPRSWCRALRLGRPWRSVLEAPSAGLGGVERPQALAVKGRVLVGSPPASAEVWKAELPSGPWRHHQRDVCSAAKYVPGDRGGWNTAESMPAARIWCGAAPPWCVLPDLVGAFCRDGCAGRHRPGVPESSVAFAPSVCTQCHRAPLRCPLPSINQTKGETHHAQDSGHSSWAAFVSLGFVAESRAALSPRPDRGSSPCRRRTRVWARMRNHFYAVDNQVIGKYDKKTGKLVKKCARATRPARSSTSTPRC